MKLIVLILLFLPYVLFSQKIKIDSTSFTIKHGDLTFYLDSDTNSFVSVHKVSKKEILLLDGDRSDKWHVEKPNGPYKKNFYSNTDYDLGHLTPSNITSYDDSLNYHSFSFFNQAPQTSKFNRGKWSQLEKEVVEIIKNKKLDASIITGVIYNNVTKTYLNNSKIKIPLIYYKVLILKGGETFCWVGSNDNGLIEKTDLKTILELNRKNKNKINIIVK